MARKRTRSIRDLREEADAVEARERDQDEVTDEEVDEDADDEADEEAEEKPVKKKVVKKAKAPAKPRATKKAAKEVRMKAVWVVFDNSSKRVETFPFNQKAEAESLLAKKIEEKKTTFYLQLVKEPIEE